jgi:D-sedoheptulose 7-phosphate isomerase
MDAEAARSRSRAYLADAEELLRRVRDDCVEDIVRASELLLTSYRAGGKVLICGNGGSAADAQHLATEFVSTLTLEHPRPSIAAVALTTDTSLLTAIANDFGVEGMFARQVESIGRPGDVLIAISTSGRSANVVRAAERARELDLRVLALTGASGGALGPIAHVAVRVPSVVTAHIQECHLTIEQLIASIVEDELYPTASPDPA